MIADSVNDDMARYGDAWTRSGCGLDVYRRDGVVTMTDSLMSIPSSFPTTQQSMPSTEIVLLPFCPIFPPFRAPPTFYEQNRRPCLAFLVSGLGVRGDSGPAILCQHVILETP